MKSTKATTVPAIDGKQLFKNIHDTVAPFDVMGNSYGSAALPNKEEIESLVQDFMKDKDNWLISHRSERVEWKTADSDVELITNYDTWDVPISATLTLKQGNRVLMKKEFKY
ncbi:MAG: hypothetical protein QM737_22730 [Ferruginibacter sp.]